MINKSNSQTTHDILGRHSVHPFPARMAPGLAFDVVAKCRKPLHILDPMSCHDATTGRSAAPRIFLDKSEL